MNKIQKFISNLRGKAATTLRLTSTRLTAGYTYFINGLAYKYHTRNHAEFLNYGYGKNPYVYSVVEKIARIVSNLPRVLTDEKGEELSSSTSLLAFEDTMKKPNHIDTGGSLIHKLVTSLLVTGNAILFEVKGEGTAMLPGVDSLWSAVIPDVEIRTDNNKEFGRPIEYAIQNHGKIPAEDVLHIRLPNTIEESNWGLSPLYAGQTVYTASNDTWEAKAHIHKNRGVSGILSAKDTNMPIMPDEQERLQNTWDKQNSGPQRTGGVHVTTAAMQYLDIGMSSKDLELIKHDISNLRAVCNLYGLDSAIFNDPDNKTYANRQEAEKAMYKDVILPLSKMVIEEVGRWVLERSNLKGEYKVDTTQVEVLNRPDQERSDKIISEVNAGILTAEQALEMLYPELDYEVETVAAI